MRPLSALKSLIVPSGKKDSRLRLGLLKGLNYGVDFKSDMQVYTGLAELELRTWFERFSRDAQTAIDVGGAHGYYTLFFLAKTGVKRVFSFEPDPDCLRNFRHNLALNPQLDLSRHVLSTKLVGAKADERFTTLDSLIGEVESPCIVKIDVEGGEMDALRGAENLLAMRNMRWIIEVHSSKLFEQCSRLFTDNGYHVIEVHRSPLRLVFPEQRPAEFNTWIVAEQK